MNELIELTFTTAEPTLVLLPVTPSEAPAAFADVIVGKNGDATDVETDDLEGFTTDPIFYYLLSSN